VDVVVLPRVVVVAATVVVVVVARELVVVAPGPEVVGDALPTPPPAATITQARTPRQATRTGKPTRARRSGDRFFAPPAAASAIVGTPLDGGAPAGDTGRFGDGERVDLAFFGEGAGRGVGAGDGCFETAAAPAAIAPTGAGPTGGSGSSGAAGETPRGVG
jgi:hypothetical protein